MLYSTILALVCINTCTASSRLQIRAPCDDEHALCAPEEARSNETPSVGSDMADLLEDLISSVAVTEKDKRHLKQVKGTLVGRAPSDNLCCVLGASCLLLEKRRLPFCYNQFNTDFVLPGNSTGNINTGRYESSNGDVANLHNGNYMLQDGTSGNIYGDVDSPANRDTATLPLPTKFIAQSTTSSDIEFELRVVTLPGTTVSASTIPEQTLPPVTAADHVVNSPVTVPAVTVQGTTIPEKLTTITVPLRRLGEPVVGSA